MNWLAAMIPAGALMAASVLAASPALATPPPAALSAKSSAAYEAGLEALREMRLEAAIGHFDDVLDERRDHPEANYFSGLAYALAKDDRRAERLLERAATARASFIEAREWLAIVRIRRGKVDDARADLSSLKALQEGCTPNLCDDLYVARASRAIERVEGALSEVE